MRDVLIIIPTYTEIENIENIIERERYWIKFYNCIENGYNSKL